MQTLAQPEALEWPHGDAGARVLGASKRRRGPFAALTLAYLALLYRIGVRLRNTAYEAGVLRVTHAAVPVISVGNIVAGGAGKTPFVRWLVNELVERGRQVAILHGGYGSDEPQLHRKWQPRALVIEERDRVRAARFAQSRGADVIVLDDAFQHRRLARDLDIVLVPVETSDRRMLPRGPLREPSGALARADAIVVTRKTGDAARAQELAAELAQKHGKPVATVALLPGGLPEVEGPVAMVAAIARPDLLLAQLRALNVRVVRALAYPDHHEYTPKDADHISRVIGDLPIVTTEKDIEKLKQIFPASRLWVLEQRLVVESGGDALMQALERVL